MLTRRGSADRYEVADGWGERPTGWEWGQVASVTVDADDNVHAYTCTDHPVMVFDREGLFLYSLGEGSSATRTTCASIEPKGVLLVVDREAHVALKVLSRDQGSFTKSADAREDLIGGLDPDAGLGVLVAYGEVAADRLLEFVGAAVGSAPHLLLSEPGEPELDLVDPGRVGGREVEMDARVARQLAHDRR